MTCRYDARVVQIFVLTACSVGLLVMYSLAMRLLRTTTLFIGELIDVMMALLFFIVIAPVVWLWEKSKRPMWRTLTKAQTNELGAWLRR